MSGGVVLDDLAVGHRTGRRRPPRTVLSGVAATAAAGEETIEGSA